MTRKRKKIKLASFLRKKFKIEFVESQILANDIFRFGGHQAFIKNEFDMKSKIPCRCGSCIKGEIVYVKSEHYIPLDGTIIEHFLKNGVCKTDV